MKTKLLSKSQSVLKNNKGFTLVELLVAMGIFAIVLTVVFQFFNFSGKLFMKTDDLASKQDQARLIIQGLRKDLGTAFDVAIISSADPGSLTVPTGSLMVYITADQLSCKDHSGTVKTIYSSAPVNFLSVTFSSQTATPSVIHIAVYAEGTLLAETDITTLNTTVNTNTATGFAANGNMVLYTLSE